MRVTHNAAMSLYREGRLTEAWAKAQEDEGLLPEVTEQQWLAFAAKCEENRNG